MCNFGDNTNLIDTVSVGNAAEAHLLAAAALLDPNRAASRVDGEVFNITDGNPVPFWDLSRLIWRASGDFTPLENVIVIPVWLALGLAITAEWTFFILTLGQKNPKTLNKLVPTYPYDYILGLVLTVRTSVSVCVFQNMAGIAYHAREP